MKIIKCAIVSLVALGQILFVEMGCARNGRFNGDWEYLERADTSGNENSVLRIELAEANDGVLSGSYCFVTQNGTRADCDTSGIENIHGRVMKDGHDAKVNFYSFFGAKDGMAILSVSGDTLTWKVTVNPVGDFFYGPYFAKLHRKRSDSRKGERRIVVDNATVYPSPSASAVETRLSKGTYVKLISISEDLKHWNVSYTTESGIGTGWIDCRAITFCP